MDADIDADVDVDALGPGNGPVELPAHKCIDCPQLLFGLLSRCTSCLGKQSKRAIEARRQRAALTAAQLAAPPIAGADDEANPIDPIWRRASRAKTRDHRVRDTYPTGHGTAGGHASAASRRQAPVQAQPALEPPDWDDHGTGGVDHDAPHPPPIAMEPFMPVAEGEQDPYTRLPADAVIPDGPRIVVHGVMGDDIPGVDQYADNPDIDAYANDANRSPPTLPLGGAEALAPDPILPSSSTSANVDALITNLGAIHFPEHTMLASCFATYDIHRQPNPSVHLPVNPFGTRWFIHFFFFFFFCSALPRLFSCTADALGQ